MEVKDIIAELLGMGVSRSHITEQTGIRGSAITRLLNDTQRDVLSTHYRLLFDLLQRKRKGVRRR